MQLLIYNKKVIVTVLLMVIFICGKAQQNVGIGTTTPTAKLHVNGTLKVTDGSQGAGKVLTSNAAGLASWKAPEKLFFKIVGFEGNGKSVAPNDTITLTDWKTVKVNVNGNGLSENGIFVNAQGEYIVFKTGLYRISIRLQVVQGSDAGNHVLSIFQNTTSKARLNKQQARADELFLTTILNLGANDKISFKYENASSSNTYITSNFLHMLEQSEFTIEKID